MHPSLSQTCPHPLLLHLLLPRAGNEQLKLGDWKPPNFGCQRSGLSTSIPQETLQTNLSKVLLQQQNLSQRPTQMLLLRISPVNPLDKNTLSSHPNPPLRTNNSQSRPSQKYPLHLSLLKLYTFTASRYIPPIHYIHSLRVPNFARIVIQVKHPIGARMTQAEIIAIHAVYIGQNITHLDPSTQITNQLPENWQIMPVKYVLLANMRDEEKNTAASSFAMHAQTIGNGIMQYDP